MALIVDPIYTQLSTTNVGNQVPEQLIAFKVPDAGLVAEVSPTQIFQLRRARRKTKGEATPWPETTI